MATESAPLLVPAAAVPVASEVWRILGNHHEMSDADVDAVAATRALVGLARLVRLDGMNRLVVETLEQVGRFVCGVSQRYLHCAEGRRACCESSHLMHHSWATFLRYADSSWVVS